MPSRWFHILKNALIWPYPALNLINGFGFKGIEMEKMIVQILVLDSVFIPCGFYF